MAVCINRNRFGHFKSDTVLDMRKTRIIGTRVDRKSGYLIAFKLKTKADKKFSDKTINVFNKLPAKLKKSVTVDNRKEAQMRIQTDF